MDVFSSTYLGPLSYFAQLRSCKEAIIDLGEHYKKQTYRNRCHVCGPNGLLKLSIPIDHSNKEHTAVKDIKISNGFNWQILHWRSLESSYRRSPYFEFYEGDLAPFYLNNKPIFLIDFTIPLMQHISILLGLNTKIHISEKYVENADKDYRESISPKIKEEFNAPAYIQVFEEKTGHISNPSIIDLLFNEGPQSLGKL